MYITVRALVCLPLLTNAQRRMKMLRLTSIVRIFWHAWYRWISRRSRGSRNAGFLYSLMNISFHRSRRAAVSPHRGHHAFMPAGEIARVSFWIAKSRSGGANRVTELRDRIKTASVCPLLWRPPSRAAQEEDYIEIPDVKFKLRGTIICICGSLFLLFYLRSPF